MKSIFQTLLKSLLVGLVFVFSLILGGIIVNAVGLRLPETKDPIGKLIGSFFAGTIAGLSLGPIAAFVPAKRNRHLFIWTCVIFLNLASVVVEGFFFAPEIVRGLLPSLLVQQFLAALGTGWIITALYAFKVSTATGTSTILPSFSWIWRLPACTLTYVIFYFIFGAANYMLVTKPFYETHAGGLSVPPVTVTLTAEIMRGTLITLSILPFLLSKHGLSTKKAYKRRLAVQSGLILFFVGGIVPLTLQVGELPFVLLAASAVEIFFQNFFTGAVISRIVSYRIGKPLALHGASKRIWTRTSGCKVHN